MAWGAGKLIDRAIVRGAMEKSFQKLAGLALALLCYGTSELLGGNGFIAAFVGGITFGSKHHEQRHGMVSFLDAEGQLLMLVVFLGLGSALAVPALQRAPFVVIGYALSSLTIVRMVPIALSLFGSGLRPVSYLFLGRFGPRGLASLLYAVPLLHDAPLPHEQLVFDAVVVTALISVLLHGMTAAAGARLYGHVVREKARAQAEHERVLEHPWRRTG